MKHQHPIKILKLASKNFWLLLIPLVRGLISLRWDFYTWLRGAWFDVLIILLIGASAYLRWYFTWFELTGSTVHIKAGVLLRSEFNVPFSSICAVSAERRFFFRPLKAVNLYLDTNSGSKRHADVQITVRRRDYQALFKLIADRRTVSGIKTLYSPSKFNLISFSILFSSTLSGVIFIVTLLIESGRILGNFIQDTLLTAINDVSRNLALGLPPLAVGISLFLIAGWIFTFISSLLRHLNFKIQRLNNIITIHNGFFTKHHYYINSDKINYADLRQNLLAKLFSVMSVHVDCSGYGKAKNEVPVFVPITTESQIFSSLELLLPGMSVVPGGIKPRRSYFFRFIWLPFFTMISIPVLINVLLYLFPLLNSMILFVGIMSEIPVIWLLIAKFVNFYTTRISFSDKNLCLKYSRHYAFHTIIVPKNKIAKISVKQSIIQILSKSCDVMVYTNSEFTRCHTIISMPAKDVFKLLSDAGLSLNTDNNVWV